MPFARWYQGRQSEKYKPWNEEKKQPDNPKQNQHNPQATILSHKNSAGIRAVWNSIHRLSLNRRLKRALFPKRNRFLQIIGPTFN